MTRASFIGWASVLASATCTAVGPGNPSGADGTARLAFTLPSGLEIDSVSYLVAPSTRGGSSAQIDTRTAGASVSFVVNLPPDPAVIVYLSATTTTGVSCFGSSAPFAVASGVTTTVTLDLVCGAGAASQSPGLANITATVLEADGCPSITALTVAPARTSVNGVIDVMASASDPDAADTLSFQWSSPGGTFTSAGAPATQFSCATSGNQTIQVTVSDNHTPSCSTSVSVPVNCHTSTCQQCEWDGTQQESCFSTSVPGDSTMSSFGCAGFPGAQQVACLELHACLASSACQAAIASATPDYLESYVGFDDPLPCLCGNVPQSTCLGATSWTGVCASQYVAAAAAAGKPLLDSFNDYSTPVGVANNLAFCDVDQGCLPCSDAPTWPLPSQPTTNPTMDPPPPSP